MPKDGGARRVAYVAAVRALADIVAPRRAAGWTDEAIARELVARRNALKSAARAFDEPAIVALMEARNSAKYGDPIGPDADWFFRKYGSWSAVIAAACRPADLSRSLERRIF